MKNQSNQPPIGIQVQRQIPDTGRWVEVATSDSWTTAVAVRDVLMRLHPNTEWRLHEPAAIHRHAADARHSLALVQKIAHSRGLYAVADAFDRLVDEVDDKIKAFDIALIAEDEAAEDD